MRLRNDADGYGAITRSLHWLTAALLVAQLILGYRMEEFAEAFVNDDSDFDESLVFVHAGLGIAVMGLATIRLVWRTTTRLPDWSDRLSAADRRVQHVVERVLYLALFLMPATGIALLYLSGEERDIAEEREWQPPLDVVDADLVLAAHIATHILLYVAVALHVAIVARRRTLRRML